MLAEVGHDGKVLAGGQSLVPLLNMRLAAPAHLVDVNWLAELDEVAATTGRSGWAPWPATPGSSTTPGPARPCRCSARRSATSPTAPSATGARWSAAWSTPTRRPSCRRCWSCSAGRWSWPAPATAVPARVAAADFFLGPLESALRPGELATAAVFPTPPAGTGSAWLELARRHGDYALCGVGVLVALDEGLRVEAARAALISVGPVPVPVDLTDALGGQPHDAADWAAAGRLAAAAVDPEDDIHATAAYRRHLAGVLTARAARAAAAHAAGRGGPR